MRLAFVAGLALSLVVPGVALAANVATFSSRTPGSGTSTTNTKPTISVKVYDAYGIKGSGAFYMSVDGKAVTPSVVYYTTGSFDPSHPDYRRPKLTYKPSTALAAGSHKVYVKVKDRKGHISTTTWYFKVTAPEPPYSAAFSSAAPAVESTTFVTRPTIKVHGYDKYGVSGSGTYALYVDGVRITTAIKYTVSGVARSFDLTGKPASPLALGEHWATAKVTDLHKHVTYYRWTFTVVPEPPYAASFSAMTPANGSSTLATMPLLSVRVYDKYGVQGAGSYGLVVDGAAVTPTIKYTTAGSYLNLTLSYKPSLPLAAGSHAVTATVTDLHANVSSTSWSFEVSIPPAPLVEMPVTIESSSCGSCHVGYPATHPMTACESCHGTGRPVPGPAYNSYSNSAHTLTCAVSVCHRPGVTTFPHVLYSDCTLCHEGQYANIPAEHGAPDASVHISSNTYCTRSGCHQASLTIEHYRRTINGVRLSCATCHKTSDADVRATLAAGSTDCIGCHVAAGTTHRDLATAHAPAALSCTVSGCHSGSLPATHKGACTPCHAGSTVPSNVCTACHPLDIHATAVTQHTAPAQTCTAATCHGTNAMAIHMPRGALACQSCHAVGKTPSLVCTTCHTLDYASIHYPGDGPHPVENECTVSGCHATGDSAVSGDVAIIHTTGKKKPGCIACHTPKASTVDCLECHQRHSELPAHQIDPACASCHGADVSLIHTTGPKHPGCGVCHTGTGTPTIVCGTVGCHAGGVLGSHSSHPSTVTAAAISINGVDYGSHECTDCHASVELQKVHGENGTLNSCAKCHPSPASTAAKGSFACAQGGCHTAASGNMKAMHGSIDTAHVASSLPSGWTCTTGTCHTGTNDVAKIHAPKLGCATCHGGGKVPTLVCDSAGCHPDGAPDSHNAHPVTVTSGTITILGNDYAGVKCADCHAPLELQSLHGGRTSCATCHPAPRDSFTDWNGGCVQGGCHSATSTKPMHAAINTDHTPTSDALTTCGGADCHGTFTSLAALHASGPGCAACHNNPDHATSRICTDCHTPHDLTAAHAAAPAPGSVTIGATSYGPFECSTCHSPLDLRTVHKDDCSTCHAPVISKTGDVWAKGCVQGACHSSGSTKPMHAAATTAHAFTVPTGWQCMNSGCHVGGDLAALHAPKQGCATCHGGTKTPTATCSESGCHTDVSGGIPGGHIGLHAVERTDTCAASACHGSADTNLTTIHAAGGCQTCHAGTVAQRVKDAIAAGDKSCANCHGFSDHKALHEVVRTDTCAAAECHGSADTNLMTIHAAGGCATCHADTAVQRVKDAIASHDKGCANCHGFTDHVSQHAVDRTKDSCAGASCHPASLDNLTTIHVAGCATCHADGASATVKGAIANHDKRCATCHADAHEASHQWCNDCHASATYNSGGLDHNVGPVPNGRSCSSCHGSPFVTLDGSTWVPQTYPHTCDPECHGGIDYTPSGDLHTVVRSDTCAAAGCHDASKTNLTTIHAAGGCATCHADSASTATKNAIATHNKGCANCHGFSDHVTQHAVDRSKDYCSGSGCHDSSLTNLTTIHVAGCKTCHSDTVSATVSNAIANHDKTCATCHADAHSASHVMCASCHTHVAGDPNDPRVSYDDGGPTHWPLTLNNRACSTCHGAPFQPLNGLGTSHQSCGSTREYGHNGCHVPAPTADQHYVARTDTCAAASCHGATQTNLTTIHAAGGCAACHASTVTQQVKDAVAAGNKSCANCHGFTDHTSQHAVDRSKDYCSGSGCHDLALNNLTTIHAAGCTTCHNDGATAEVKAAIASHNKSCTACHTLPHADSHQWCTDCHTWLDGVTYYDPAYHHSQGPQPDQACSNCHGTTFAPLDGAQWVLTTDHISGCSNPDCHNGETFGGPGNDRHTVARTDTCAAAGCHPNGTNLTTIHAAGGCATCHASTVTQQVKDAVAAGNKGCANCHGFTDHVTQHMVVRIDTCAAAGCHDATKTNLTTIHTGGCVTCHSDTASTATKNAIASHNKDCANCHGFTDHVTQHAVVRNDTCAASGCHDATNANLTTIHTGGCITCHSDTASTATKNAIANHNKGCANCHGFTDHVSQHAVVRNDTCAASGCHDATNANLTTIHTGGCITCHSDTASTATKNAIANHNKGCANCHGFTDHVSQHAVDRTKDSCAGADCHAASLNNLMTIHTAGCTTCHADTVSDTVKNAIAAHDKTCATCHALAHAASHQWCNDCHENLPSITGSEGHGTTAEMPNRPCSDCHGSPFAPISGIGVSHDLYVDPGTGQTGCYAANCHHYVGTLGEPTADLHYVSRTDTCAAAGCHDATNKNLTTIHTGCATCHGSGASAATKAAVAAGNKGCANCHGFSDHVGQHAVVRSDTCVGAGCHPATLTNLTTIHADGCATCHATGVRQQVKDAITNKNKACSACHVTTISSLTLHPNYTTLHNASASGCTGTYCHPASALDVHGRTGCTNSCHKNPVSSLTLSCNSGTCHSGVYGGSTLTSHVNLHTTDYYWVNNDFGMNMGPTCKDCHGTPYDWHEDGVPLFGPISSSTSCSSIGSSWGALACHSGTPGYSGAQGWNHSCSFDCH